MKAQVMHDEHGNIKSIAVVGSETKARLVAGPGYTVSELEISELKSKPATPEFEQQVREIMAEFTIEAGRATLRRKTAR